MATKKIVKKAKAERQPRQPKKGGLVDKKAFVVANFVKKGLTRSDAVAGLQKKYPDMSLNYARTVVYGQLKDERWKEAPRTAKPKKASSAKKSTQAKKPSSTPKPKASKVAAAADDGGDDFDF